MGPTITAGISSLCHAARRAALLAAASAALLAHPCVAAAASEPQPALRAEVSLEQRLAKRERLKSYRVTELEAKLRRYEKRPYTRKLFVKGYRGFRPVIGGLPSGSGLVAGVGYVAGREHDWLRFEASARTSTLGYDQVDVRLGFPSARSDLPLTAHLSARYADYNSLRFYGLGSESPDVRTTYELQQRRVSGGGSFKPHRRFELSGEAGLLNTSLGPGTESPALDAVFDPASIPGFESQPEYLFYSGGAALDLRDGGEPGAGPSLRLGLERYAGRDLETFDFTRLTGDFSLYVPLGYRNRMLAFRFRTSHSTPDAGGEVPFQLMETLGGAKSIRGFDEYRFRDRRNLLLSLEYRWEVWSYVDFALFVDSGKVFRDRADFDLDGLAIGYGFGVRFHSPKGSVFRIDLARSDEGLKLHIGAGPRF